MRLSGWRRCVADLLPDPETKGLALEDVDRLFAKDEETRRRMSVDAAEIAGSDTEWKNHANKLEAV